MIYLNAFLITEEEKAGKLRMMKPGKPRIRYGEEEDVGLTCFFLPERWLKRPDRLPDRLEKLECRTWRQGLFPAEAKGGQRWYSPALRRRMGWSVPLPDMDWMRRILLCQPFCPHLTVILPDFGEEDRERELETELSFLEELLQEGYESRNSLLLISRALEGSGFAGEVPLMEVSPYCDRIYLETGLVTRCAGEWKGGRPEGTGQPVSSGHLCMDLRGGYRIPFRILPDRTLYLDMTSDAAKERLLGVKRKDVHYMSPLNFLDTYVRNRYNTYR